MLYGDLCSSPLQRQQSLTAGQFESLIFCLSPILQICNQAFSSFAPAPINSDRMVFTTGSFQITSFTSCLRDPFKVQPLLRLMYKIENLSDDTVILKETQRWLSRSTSEFFKRGTEFPYYSIR